MDTYDNNQSFAGGNHQVPRVHYHTTQTTNQFKMVDGQTGQQATNLVKVGSLNDLKDSYVKDIESMRDHKYNPEGGGATIGYSSLDKLLISYYREDEENNALVDKAITVKKDISRFHRITKYSCLF